MQLKFPEIASGMAQAVECLPIKCEAVSSKPQRKKKKKRELVE
jgi:hypothetical protein